MMDMRRHCREPILVFDWRLESKFILGFGQRFELRGRRHFRLRRGRQVDGVSIIRLVAGVFGRCVI